MLVERMTGAAYDWHNYGKETIGARSDVEGVDIGRLQAFYRTYYQPDNAVLVVAGKFDPDETLGWIAKIFGAIPKPARALPRLYTRRAGAGRRAQRRAAPRRRHAARRRPLSHGSGRASGRHRRRRARARS